jgi:hypothetical protein
MMEMWRESIRMYMALQITSQPCVAELDEQAAGMAAMPTACWTMAL